jgi:putative thiamine transport system ATP-binding protein
VSLALQDVSIRLAGRVLVPPLRLTVGPGEVVAVMGPSGCGKSSLLSWLAGLDIAPLAGSGRVLVDGADLTDAPTEQRRIGLLFQDDLLYPHWTLRQNLLFALPPGPRAEREAAVERALAAAELPGLGARRPHALSGGQRARVSLMRALLARPRALLLDEPFSKLDAALRARMREHTWQAVRDAGVPALLVTHDAADVPPGAPVLALGQGMGQGQGQEAGHA